MESVFAQMNLKLPLKIQSAVQTLVVKSVYPSSIYTEYNAAQTFMAVVVYYLTCGDMKSVMALLAFEDQIPQLKSSFIGSWLKDDFNFVKQDVAKALETLAQLVVNKMVSCDSHLVLNLTCLEQKYGLEGYLMQSTIPWAENVGKEAVRIEGDNLEKGVEKRRKDNPAVLNNSSSTSLMAAAENGCVETVKQLLRSGANVNYKDDRGYTSLQMAAMAGKTEVVKVLLANGARANLGSNGGWTPLHWAARYGKTGVVRVLVDRGARVNVDENYGQTPLHLAAREGRTEVVRLLLDAGAEVNARTKYGDTPLGMATKAGQKEAVQNIYFVSPAPHGFATSFKYRSTIALLRAKGGVF